MTNRVSVGLFFFAAITSIVSFVCSNYSKTSLQRRLQAKKCIDESPSDPANFPPTREILLNSDIDMISK